MFKANHNIDFIKNLYPQSKGVDQYINQHQNVADLAPGKQKQKRWGKKCSVRLGLNTKCLWNIMSTPKPSPYIVTVLTLCRCLKPTASVRICHRFAQVMQIELLTRLALLMRFQISTLEDHSPLLIKVLLSGVYTLQ